MESTAWYKAEQLCYSPLRFCAVDVTKLDGKPYIIFQPVVEAIGLDYASQLTMLRGKPWAEFRSILVPTDDGTDQRLLAISPATFFMWLDAVNHNGVTPDVRPLLISYQTRPAQAFQGANPATGITAEYDPDSQPLTVSTYLGGLGVPAREIRRIAGTFGKRLKAAFIHHYGEEPPLVRDLVGRHVVPVAQYQERHRHLFDLIWGQFKRQADKPEERIR